MTAVNEEVDDRYAGIDIDSLLNTENRRPLGMGRKKALYEPPEFIQRLNGEETVLEGQSIVLECKVRGFPAPTLRWFKDDEEIVDHPRIQWEGDGKGGYTLTIKNINRGDEAAYRCRAENFEGQCSCFFFLSVKGKRKSKKRKKDSKNSSNKRTVSFPPMFSTIVEKVEEEEKQGKEFEELPPSPLTDFYYALTLKGRQTWPTFVGDWAFTNGAHQLSPNEQRRTREQNDTDTPVSMQNGGQNDSTPTSGRAAARKSLRRSDLAARAEAKKQRVAEEAKRRVEEEKNKKEEEEKQKLKEEERKKKEEEKEEMKKKMEEMEEEESKKRQEAMRLRRKQREERMLRELKEEEEKKKKEEEEKRLKQKEKEEEERRQKEEEERRKREEEERLRKEEEERLKKEEEQKKKKEEEERKKKEEDALRKKKEEERLRREREKQKLEEEKRQKEEKMRLEAEERKKEEDRKRVLEEKRRKDEEEKKKEEERQKELLRKKEEDKRREEQKKKEQEKKKREEEERKEKERQQREKEAAEVKRREEERKKKEQSNVNSEDRKPVQKKLLGLEKFEKQGQEISRKSPEPKLGQKSVLQRFGKHFPEPETQSSPELRKGFAPLKKTLVSANENKKENVDATKAGTALKTPTVKDAFEKKTLTQSADVNKPLIPTKKVLDVQQEDIRKKEETRKREEEEKRKLEEKQRREREEAKKKEELLRKKEEEKKKLEEKERKEKEELKKKQQQQKEELKKKQEEEEKRKTEEKERKEREEMRRQFKKEQIRKEQLRRQHEEELRHKEELMRKKEEERRRKEEERKRNQGGEKLSSEADRQLVEHYEETEVKVYKRDYSFADLRKTLEAQVGGEILNPEEHKYWDAILEKHDYSIGDIKKAFDSSNPFPSTERQSRMRVRRNSIELETEIVKIKRSSSITDLRESYTKSLERPKKTSKEEKKRLKDEEFLKRRTATISELQSQFSSQQESLSSSSSIADDLSELAARSSGSTSGAKAGRSPSTLHNHPELTKLAVNVAAKRASFHEIVSQSHSQQASSSSSLLSEKAKKRMSVQTFDSYGSREIPTYRRVAAWSDDIGKSPKTLGVQKQHTIQIEQGNKLVAPGKSYEARALSPASGVLSDDHDQSNPRVRPFVYNSIRTIARNSTGSLNSVDLEATSDEELLNSMDHDDEEIYFKDGENAISGKKASMFYIDDEGDDLGSDGDTSTTSDEGIVIYNSNLDTPSLSSSSPPSSPTSTSSSAISSSSVPNSAAQVTADMLNKNVSMDSKIGNVSTNLDKQGKVDNSQTQNIDNSASRPEENFAHDINENKQTDASKNAIEKTNELLNPSSKDINMNSAGELSVNMPQPKNNPNNTGEFTPPIVVEVWDEDQGVAKPSDAENSPQTLLHGPDSLPLVQHPTNPDSTPRRPVQSIRRPGGLSLTAPKLSTPKMKLPVLTSSKDGDGEHAEFHRVPTPIPSLITMQVDSPDTSGEMSNFLSPPSGEFSNVRGPRESTPTPFLQAEQQNLYSDDSSCSSPSSLTSLSPATSPTSELPSTDFDLLSPSSRERISPQILSPVVSHSSAEARKSQNIRSDRGQESKPKPEVHHPHYHHHVARRSSKENIVTAKENENLAISSQNTGAMTSQSPSLNSKGAHAHLSPSQVDSKDTGSTELAAAGSRQGKSEVSALPQFRKSPEELSVHNNQKSSALPQLSPKTETNIKQDRNLVEQQKTENSDSKEGSELSTNTEAGEKANIGQSRLPKPKIVTKQTLNSPTVQTESAKLKKRDGQSPNRQTARNGNSGKTLETPNSDPAKIKTRNGQSPSRQIAKKETLGKTSETTKSESDQLTARDRRSPNRQTTQNQSLAKLSETKNGDSAKIKSRDGRSPNRQIAKNENVDKTSETANTEAAKIKTREGRSPNRQMSQNQNLFKTSGPINADSTTMKTRDGRSPNRQIVKKENLDKASEITMADSVKIKTRDGRSPNRQNAKNLGKNLEATGAQVINVSKESKAVTAPSNISKQQLTSTGATNITGKQITTSSANVTAQPLTTIRNETNPVATNSVTGANNLPNSLQSKQNIATNIQTLSSQQQNKESESSLTVLNGSASHNPSFALDDGIESVVPTFDVTRGTQIIMTSVAPRCTMMRRQPPVYATKQGVLQDDESDDSESTFSTNSQSTPQTPSSAESSKCNALQETMPKQSTPTNIDSASKVLQLQSTNDRQPSAHISRERSPVLTENVTLPKTALSKPTSQDAKSLSGASKNTAEKESSSDSSMNAASGDSKRGKTTKKSTSKSSKGANKKSSSLVRSGSTKQQDSLTLSSPFGKYTREGGLFLLLLTVFCLYVGIGVEKFVCYVLASYYIFCVLRVLGLLE